MANSINTLKMTPKQDKFLTLNKFLLYSQNKSKIYIKKKIKGSSEKILRKTNFILKLDYN